VRTAYPEQHPVFKTGIESSFFRLRKPHLRLDSTIFCFPVRLFSAMVFQTWLPIAMCMRATVIKKWLTKTWKYLLEKSQISYALCKSGISYGCAEEVHSSKTAGCTAHEGAKDFWKIPSARALPLIPILVRASYDNATEIDRPIHPCWRSDATTRWSVSISQEACTARSSGLTRGELTWPNEENRAPDTAPDQSCRSAYSGYKSVA
jgi:hypothetical protein